MDSPATIDPALLAAWFAQSAELLLLTDRHGRVRQANPAGRSRLAVADGDEFPALAADAATRQVLADALARGALQPTEVALRDGWFEARAAGVGGLIAWTLQDRTRLHEARARAGHLEELLEVAQEFGRLGVWEREIPSGRGHWDRHVFAFWGMDPTQGTPDYEQAMRSVHPDDRRLLPSHESELRAGRYAQRYRVVQADGRVRRIHSQWEIRNDADGRPNRAIGIMMDDTEVYELARSLGDASAQLKLAVELADIAVWRHDLRTQRLHYNERAYGLLGIAPRPEGLAIEELRALVHPDDLAGAMASAQQALHSDRPTDTQARYRRSDGSWRHLLTRRVVQRGTDGTPLAFVGVSLDVTDQVEREREAGELARRLEIAASAAGLGIWSRDPATEAGDWNEQMFELCGRSPALGVPSREEWIEQIIHPDDRATMSTARPQLLGGDSNMVEHEYRIVRPDGEIRWLVNRARREHWNGRTMIFGVTLDVTERRRAQQALRSADERAALAARSAGIGTWEVEFGERHVERWDAQMFRLRGLSPQALPPPREERLALLHPEDRAITIDANSETMASTRPSRYEFRVVWPDGSVRWLASRSIAVIDAQGQLRRRIGVNWDITDSKDAELARQQSVVAERASQAKSQFLARMSHELRTPLNAVLGFTQLLQVEADAAHDAARAAKLGHIRTAGEHLLSLIDGVLDLAGLEAGNLRLELEPVALAALVEQALPLVAALAAQHGVRLHAGTIDGVVLADRTRVLQVLVNLLSNAVKYNRPGGEVRLAATLADDQVTLSVDDTGRGLSEAQLARLFEPFNRLGAERSGIEGTGIGLTIAKALTGEMGGRLQVASRLGEGSRFSITLPRVPDGELGAAPPARTPAAAPAAPQRRGRLLYIEDNAVNVLLVEEMVRKLCGLSIESTGTGTEGVARALSLRPDLVLIDMQLPDFDGFEVLRRLRADAATAAIPCIALSANAMPADVQRALDAGFADYWTKPIDFRAFLGALESMFPLVA